MPEPQRCALCGGETRWDPTFAGTGSWYCPKCQVWTAPSDGQEAERQKRYVDIALRIVLSLLKEQRKTA